MPTHTHDAPMFVPILSVGKHRTARSGGCFMEFASYLAGERWSDHPACTHSVLAFLARLINDCTSDRARPELAKLIPLVIGLNGDDPRVELHIALRVATAALPVASETRQRALAVGILTCEGELSRRGYSLKGDLQDRIREAFDCAPLAVRWAREFVAEFSPATRQRAVSRTAESVIRVGVLGIARACSPGADERLRTLLREVIADCAAMLGSGSVELGFTGSGSLDLEEAIKTGHRNHSVPQRERLLTLRRG